MNNLDLFSYVIDILKLDDVDENVKFEFLGHKIKNKDFDYIDYFKAFKMKIVKNKLYDFYTFYDENENVSIKNISIESTYSESTYSLNSGLNNQFNLIHEIDINSSEILEETDEYLIFKCKSPFYDDCDDDLNLDLDLNSDYVHDCEFILKIYKLIEVSEFNEFK